MQKLDALLRSPVAAGVEFTFLSGGAVSIHCAILKKTKDNVQLASGSSVEDISKLKELIPADAPVFVSMDGKGVIHKRISISESDTNKMLLHKVLPNASENEFYLQRSGISEKESFISIIRKETADTLCKELSALGLQVIGCSLGPFSVNAVLPLLNGTADAYDLKFSGHRISVDGGRINLYELMDTNGAGERVKIGEDEIPGSQLVSFSSALQYFVGDQSAVNIPFVQNAREDYRQKRIFRTAGAAALAFFLVLLTINYFLLTHYSGLHNDLSQKLQMNTSLLEGFEKLSGEISEKEKFLEQTGLREASRISFYADRLAADLPVSIELTGLAVYPLIRKNLADDNDLSFTPHAIHIKGNSDKSTELNEWIKRIRSKPWVKNVSVLNYTQDHEKKTAEFSLEVAIK